MRCTAVSSLAVAMIVFAATSMAQSGPKAPASNVVAYFKVFPLGRTSRARCLRTILDVARMKDMRMIKREQLDIRMVTAGIRGILGRNMVHMACATSTKSGGNFVANLSVDNNDPATFMATITDVESAWKALAGVVCDPVTGQCQIH